MLGLLSGFFSLVTRYNSEAALQNTEILMDFDALVDWQASLESMASRASGVDAPGGGGPEADRAPLGAKDLPGRLLEAGIESLAFSELHLDDLIERGLVSTMSYQSFELALKGGGLVSPSQRDYVAASLFNVSKMSLKRPGCYLLFADVLLARQVARTLRITTGGGEGMGQPASGHSSGIGVDLLLGDRVLFVPLSVRQLRTRALGFDAEAIELWAQKGFRVWIRPENQPGLDPAQIRALFKLWKELPAVQGVIFGGALNEALGYPDQLEPTRDNLKDLHWKLGYIELPPRAQQLGIEMLVRALPNQATRVMAVPPAQQQKISPERTLGMYSLGARERNIRLLYVRPYDDGNLQDDEDFLFSLPGEIANVGPAATFEGTSSPGLIETLLSSLGAGALAVLLLQEAEVKLRSTAKLVVLVLPILSALMLIGLGHAVLFRTLLALCVGMGGPILAFLYFVYPVLVEDGADKRSDIAQGLRILFGVSLCSLLAGLWVAALLTDVTFLLGLDRFKGVKLLTLATPVLIVFCFAKKHYSLSQWLTGLKAPIRVYQAAIAGALLLLLGFLMLRTGNDAGAAASDSERYLRLYLDKALGVRPRFKEFLLAHPAMLCLSFIRRRLGFGVGLFFVLIAAIGQAGIVDTFAHVHTPLLITLIRVTLGVTFGALCGFIGIIILKQVLNVLSRTFTGIGEI